MEFWLTNGIFHRSGTLVNNMYGQYVPCYEDTGKQFIIPDETEIITIPEGTIEIGQEAFSTHFHTTTKGKKEYWQKARQVILPSSIKKIAFQAFWDMKIREINFPDGLESIGIGAFDGTNLEEVVFPDSIKEIGSSSFTHCPELKRIVFPKSFVFPQYMDNNIFGFCPKLETVEIDENANNCLSFWGCESIKKINIPEGVTKIGYCQYKDCRSLEEIVIPETITEIISGAFENCTSLKSITIPSKARTIASNAFKGCTGLQTITFKCAFKGFETAFPDSHDVKQVFISESSAGKAKTVFSDAEVFSLKGKLLFSPHGREDILKPVGAKASSQTDGGLSCPAISGELVSKSNICKFTNCEYDYDIEGAKHSFHVEFRGSQIANRACKIYYTNATKNEENEHLYDVEELIRANSELYIIEPHSGERIATLSEEYESIGEKRSYSLPLEKNEIIEYVQRFSSDLASCLSKENICKIVEYVPHKKNGTLAKGRTTIILKSAWADSEGYTLVLLAKNVADNDLDLEIKKVYIGEEKYDEVEAAKILGIISVPQKRKDKAREKALAEPYGFEGKGYTARVSKEESSYNTSAREFYERYDKYLSKTPIISIPGKNFVFSEMFQKENALEQPIIKALLARGGVYKEKVSGATDYLVAESLQSVGEYKMRMAAEQIEKGKPLQFITAESLICALKTSQPGTDPDKRDKSALPIGNAKTQTDSKCNIAETKKNAKKSTPEKETAAPITTGPVISSSSKRSIDKKKDESSAPIKKQPPSTQSTRNTQRIKVSTEKSLVEMSLEEKRAVYAKHIVNNPTIEFRGKLFTFAGVFKRNEILEAQPLVKAIKEKGGDVRTSVSQVTDYLVVSSVDNPEDAKMRKAVELYSSTRKPQLILLKDLEKTLDYPTKGKEQSSTNGIKLSDDMLPEGIEDREAIEKELSEMEPEQAQAVLDAMAELKKIKAELNDISNLINEEQKKEEEQAKKTAAIQMRKNEEADAKRQMAEREKRIAEEKKKVRKQEILTAIRELQLEMSSLRGIFSLFKRKKIQTQIDMLNDELKHL